MLEYFNLKNLRYMFYPFIPDLLAWRKRKSALDKRSFELGKLHDELNAWTAKNHKWSEELQKQAKHLENLRVTLNTRENGIRFQERQVNLCQDCEATHPLTSDYEYDRF